MLEWDELVFDPVHEEAGACDLAYLFDIFEAVLNEILKEATSLILRNSSNTLKATHQK